MTAATARRRPGRPLDADIASADFELQRFFKSPLLPSEDIRLRAVWFWWQGLSPTNRRLLTHYDGKNAQHRRERRYLLLRLSGFIAAFGKSF